MQRASELVFHGGAWVFPGGRVDAGDQAGDPLATARKAAVRETHEEAGLVLHPERLVPFAHWTTPEGRPRRFATWFFATELDTRRDVIVDGGEIRAHRWMRPADALHAQARGEIELPPPTFVTLWQLRRFARTGELLASLRGAEPAIYVPRILRVPGGEIALYERDVAYEDGDLERSGPRHRLHMLASGWRYERSSEIP